MHNFLQSQIKKNFVMSQIGWKLMEIIGYVSVLLSDVLNAQSSARSSGTISVSVILEPGILFSEKIYCG